MPSNRTRRVKKRRAPMTEAEWMFFLAKSPADFEKARQADGGTFFMLHYRDGWAKVYAEHKREIDAEWRARGWTREEKRFVMTNYLARGYRLPHDILAHERQE